MTPPPPKGTPLEPGGQIVRLAVQQSLAFDEEAPVPPNAFDLSGEEKVVQTYPEGWTSVWCEERTTPEEAEAFAKEPKPRRAIVLPTDEVRLVRSSFAPGSQLDLFWDPRAEEFDPSTGTPHLPPDQIQKGAEGHCGMSGLADQHFSPDLTRAQRSARRLAMREALAELANRPDIRKLVIDRSRQ